MSLIRDDFMQLMHTLVALVKTLYPRPGLVIEYISRYIKYLFLNTKKNCIFFGQSCRDQGDSGAGGESTVFFHRVIHRYCELSNAAPEHGLIKSANDFAHRAGSDSRPSAFPV